jgi:hypothetical protein
MARKTSGRSPRATPPADRAARSAIATGASLAEDALIDQFNAMMAEVAAIPRFSHVHYVDLRGTLSNGSGYRARWANELHPTAAGFAAVAARFATVISVL